MSARLPYTKRERRRFAQTFGNRPVNDWGSGDLPAPFAEGDIVRLDGEVADSRLRAVPRDAGHYVVAYACSVDEGDAWYFRVGCYDDNGQPVVSDRLHVAYAARCSWDEDVDYMAPFTLTDTIDPDGLIKRRQMIDAGWSFENRWQTCPTCGHRSPVDTGGRQ